MRQARYYRSGMTIVEIMIVVTLIAVVAGILAFSISSIREKVWRSQAEQELQILAAAIEQLAFDTGLWPGGLSRTTQDREVWDLTQAESGIFTNDGRFGSDWKGPYLDTIPKDPWGMNYFFDSDYNIRGAGTSIVVAVGCYGPNKIGQNAYDADDLWVEITRKK